MDGVIMLVFMLGSTLVYANLRNAVTYCRALVLSGAYSRERIVRQRRWLLTIAAMVSMLIMWVASSAALGSQAMPAALRLLLFALTTAVVFSELYEQWALRRCEWVAERRRSAARQRSGGGL